MQTHPSGAQTVGIGLVAGTFALAAHVLHGDQQVAPIALAAAGRPPLSTTNPVGFIWHQALTGGGHSGRVVSWHPDL